MYKYIGIWLLLGVGILHAQGVIAGPPVLNDGAAGTFRGTNYTTGGVMRWGMGASVDPEQGSNSGSSWILQGYGDNGSVGVTAIAVARATGVASFGVRPIFGVNTPWDSGNLNFAAPPAIGGATANAGTFTFITAESMNAATGAFTGLLGTLGNVTAGPYNTLTLVGGNGVGITSSLNAGGTDTNVSIQINPKGSGTTSVNSALGVIGALTVTGNSTLTGKLSVGGNSVLGNLVATTPSIGGSLLAVGCTNQATVIIASAATSMVCVMSGAGGNPANVQPQCSVTSAGVVTPQLCSAVAVTPTAQTYNIRVIQ